MKNPNFFQLPDVIFPPRCPFLPTAFNGRNGGGNTAERLHERAQTKVLPVLAVGESCLQVEGYRIILNNLF